MAQVKLILIACTLVSVIVNPEILQATVTCESLFHQAHYFKMDFELKAKKPRSIRAPTPAFKVTQEKSPDWHSENLTGDLNSSDPRLKLIWELYDLHENLKFLCFANPGCFFVSAILSKNDTETKLRARDLQGRNYVMTLRREENSYDTYKLISSVQEKTDSRQLLWKLLINRARKNYQQQTKLKPEALAEKISTAHLSNSETAKRYQSQEFARGLKLAYLLLTNILNSGRRFTEEDLEQINYLVNQGIHPYGNPQYWPASGVLRGTRQRLAVIGDQVHVVDLRDTQVYQGILGRRVTAFLPADQVPAAVNRLVDLINEVNLKTDLVEVFQIYQKFIRIHPFLDGNGRTARVLRLCVSYNVTLFVRTKV